MGQTGKSFFREKYYPASQRTIVLQFASPEEAMDWERAGSPISLVWPVSATPDDPQYEGDDRQDDQDRPEHVQLVPVKRRGKPRIRIG